MRLHSIFKFSRNKPYKINEFMKPLIVILLYIFNIYKYLSNMYIQTGHEEI